MAIYRGFSIAMFDYWPLPKFQVNVVFDSPRNPAGYAIMGWNAVKNVIVIIYVVVIPLQAGALPSPFWKARIFTCGPHFAHAKATFELHGSCWNRPSAVQHDVISAKLRLENPMLPTEHQQNAIDIFSIFHTMSATYLSPPDSCAPRSMLQMSWAFYGVVVGNNTSSFNYFHHFFIYLRKVFQNLTNLFSAFVVFNRF